MLLTLLASPGNQTDLSFLPGRELKRNDAYVQYSLYRKLRDEAQELVIAENNPERLFASVGSEVQHQQSQCEESAKQIL